MLTRTMRRSVALAPLRFTVAPLSAWANIPLAPPDKILGLNEAFKGDPAPFKVNLGVGAYRDDEGKPYVLPSIKEAEKRVMENYNDHEYAGIAGVQSFLDLSIAFALGSDSAALKEGRVASVQAISGTGACRIVGEFWARFFGKGSKIYMPNPTWGNHHNIFRDSGLEPAAYSYYDSSSCAFDFQGMLRDVEVAESGSLFLLHACAHNPTGCDPSKEQWDQLSQAFKAKGHVVFFDCAYQGFASGDAEKDAYAVRKFAADGHNLILSQSFAKNFGLYGERIGTLSVVGQDKEEAARLASQLKAIVRPMYSNPPVYGARLVVEVLKDEALRQQWTTECRGMADRIIKMRHLLKDSLVGLGSTRDWSHITDQIGMFCFTGLNKEQVLQIRGPEHAIYCTEDGRISMAGITSANVAHVAKAIHTVTAWHYQQRRGH